MSLSKLIQLSSKAVSVVSSFVMLQIFMLCLNNGLLSKVTTKSEHGQQSCLYRPRVINLAQALILMKPVSTLGDNEDKKLVT